MVVVSSCGGLPALASFTPLHHFCCVTIMLDKAIIILNLFIWLVMDLYFSFIIIKS